MNTEGIETLKSVARRSLWIVLLCVALAIALMNFLRQSQGPQYQASSKVVLSPTDLTQTFAGSQSFVDPTLLDDTEQALARSPQLFDRAARRFAGTLGSGSELDSATSVQKSGTTVTFTAAGRSPDRVVKIANAVARAYPGWRADVSSAAIQNAIIQVKAQLSVGAKRDPSLLDQLNRLNVLKTLTSGNVLLVEPAHGVTKTRPSPVRDSIIGAFIGLFVALLIVAVREAVDTRVRSEEEVEDLLGVPVVGAVERLPRRGGGLVVGGRAHPDRARVRRHRRERGVRRREERADAARAPDRDPRGAPARRARDREEGHPEGRRLDRLAREAARPGRKADGRVPHRRLRRGESVREQAFERVAGRQGDHRQEEGRGRRGRRAARER